jgi:hypothetical protein
MVEAILNPTTATPSVTIAALENVGSFSLLMYAGLRGSVNKDEGR